MLSAQVSTETTELRVFYTLLSPRTPMTMIAAGLCLLALFISTVGGGHAITHIFGAGEVGWLVLCALTALPLVALVVWQRATHLQLIDRMELLSQTDLLTRFPNRPTFVKRAAKALTRSTGTMLLLNADNFRRINDEYGHTVGDMCLETLAEHIRGFVRRTDEIGRLGGEEFAIFMPGLSVADAEKVARRLSEGTAINCGSSRVPLTFSVGMTRAGPHTTLDEALNAADSALTRAKSEGRACYRAA